MSKSLPNAGKPGKRRKDSGGGGETRGSESSHKLDPKAVQTYGAFCGDCGSLGNYLNQRDATNAENLHQQRAHQNSPHKKTVTGGVHGEQNRRNKGGGK